MVATLLFANEAIGSPNFMATLDPSFGRGGRVVTDIQTPSHNSISADVAVQPDGKIVVVGYATHGTYSRPDFSIMRFNPDGTLDSSFGVGGIVATTFFIQHEEASALALQPDGKVLAGGWVVLPDTEETNAFGIARYNVDGSLDYTFGNDGLATTVVEEGSRLTDIVVQPDGKIVAAGTSGSEEVAESHFALSRFNPDGSIDITFGNQGEVFMDFPGQYDYLKAIALTSDGRIVAGGETDTTGVLARFTPLGTPDPTFGTNGQVVLTGTEVVGSLAVLPDGKILTGSSFQQWPDGYHYAARRYLGTGALDTSFSGDGLASTLVSDQSAYVSKLLVAGDGKIVLAGAIYAGDHFDVGVVRFEANGNIDTSFGNNGVARATLPPYYNEVWSAAFTPDGGIVTCGRSRYDSALAKFTSSGALATSFGSDGKVTVRGTLASSNSVRAIALQAHGKIVAFGSVEKRECEECVRSDVGLVRYNSDGSVDKSFGTNGVVAIDYLDRSWDEANALVVQPDGKIIVGGSFLPYEMPPLGYMLMRLHPDGSIDQSFGVDGRVITGIPQGETTLAGLALQPDGKIVAAGGLRNEGNTDFLLVRYLSDGALDSSFGSGGIVLTDFGTSHDGARAIALTENDQIIAAGTTATFTHAITDTGVNFALARYMPNGELDLSFGLGGKTISDYQRQENRLTAMTLDSLGRIVVAGYTGTYSETLEDSVSDFALARYTQNGLLDVSFGLGGWRVTDFGEINESATSLVTTSDGKITTIGYTGYRKWGPVYNGTYGGFDFDIALTRHDETGSPDTSFGPAGKLRMDLGGGESLTSALLDSEQRLVVAGGLQIPLYTDADFLLLRFGNATAPAATATPTRTISPTRTATHVSTISPTRTATHVSTISPTRTATHVSTISPTRTATHVSTISPTRTATSTNTATPTRTAVLTNTVPATSTATHTKTASPTNTQPATNTRQPTSTTVPTNTVVPTNTACTTNFKDVPANHTFYSFIRCLACRGVMGGYGDNTFRPGNKVTRAQLAKIVGNASGIVESGGPQRFQDVPNSGGTASFYNQINGLVAAGVMSGYACGGSGEPCVTPGNLPYFRPSANATRGQIAKIVANAAQLQSPVSGQTFTDVPASSTFYPYVQRLTAMNVMSGYACGSTNPDNGQPELCDAQNRAYFRPGNNASRGQVSKIVANTFYPNCQSSARK